MQRWSWLLALALAGATIPLASATAVADEHGEKSEKVVSLDQIPAPAKQTILREAGGAPILKVEQETEKDKTLYEAHVKKGDDVIGILVDASGKLIDKHSEKSEKKYGN
jgi:uncharacterized membrane protein YkoI